MRLLFDENLSRRLVHLLATEHPDATHVSECGLAGSSDEEIWAFAGTNGLTIVTKDSDFHARSLLLGPPPKVLWLRCGNAGTGEIARLLREQTGSIRRLEHDDVSYLAIYAASPR